MKKNEKEDEKNGDIPLPKDSQLCGFMGAPIIMNKSVE